MSRYSAERKESVIQKMMPPHNIPIPRLAEETGIPDVTLYNWRKQARLEGIAVPADGKNPEKWSSEDKFAVVLEAVLQPLVQHGAQAQWFEIYYAGAASHGQGNGDTGASETGLPRSEGASSQPLVW